MSFANWLQKQLNERGWSQTDLIRHVTRAGYQLSSPHLSRIMTGHRDPNPEICIGIAHALELPREEVFRARGWLLSQPDDPHGSEIDPRAFRLIRETSALPLASREVTLDLIEAVLDSAHKLTKAQSLALNRG